MLVEKIINDLSSDFAEDDIVMRRRMREGVMAVLEVLKISPVTDKLGSASMVKIMVPIIALGVQNRYRMDMPINEVVARLYKFMMEATYSVSADKDMAGDQEAAIIATFAQIFYESL